MMNSPHAVKAGVGRAEPLPEPARQWTLLLWRLFLHSLLLLLLTAHPTTARASTFSAGLAGFFRGEFMSCSLQVCSAASLCGDLSLFRRVHRGKATYRSSLGRVHRVHVILPVEVLQLFCNKLCNQQAKQFVSQSRRTREKKLIV